jgi:hypothetical protein
MDRRKAKVYVEYMGDIVEIEDLIDSFWDFIPDTDKA